MPAFQRLQWSARASCARENGAATYTLRGERGSMVENSMLIRLSPMSHLAPVCAHVANELCANPFGVRGRNRLRQFRPFHPINPHRARTLIHRATRAQFATVGSSPESPPIEFAVHGDGAALADLRRRTRQRERRLEKSWPVHVEPEHRAGE